MYPAIPIPFVEGAEIPTYSLMFAIGFALTLIICCNIAKKENTGDWHDVLYSAMYALIGIGVGAKLVFILTKLPKAIEHWDIFTQWMAEDFPGAISWLAGGLVFYGGLIGALLGLLIYSKQFKVSLSYIFDYVVPFFPFIHAFGRVGCFLAGCCYGMEYHGFLAVQFPENPIVPELNEVPRLPIQLIEAAANLIIFAVLLYLRKKKKTSPYGLIGIYLIAYGVLRFTLEFFRGDAVRGFVLGLSTSQLISILVIPFGIFLLVKHGKRVEAVPPMAAEEVSGNANECAETEECSVKED